MLDNPRTAPTPAQIALLPAYERGVAIDLIAHSLKSASAMEPVSGSDTTLTTYTDITYSDGGTERHWHIPGAGPGARPEHGLDLWRRGYAPRWRA